MNHIRYYIALLTLTLVTAVGAALPPETYAPASALAEGRWVKASVSATGMHFVSVSTLRSWGFSDPSKVRVYGYGGSRISDILSASTYVDDLPQAPMEVTASGIYFYAQGPVDWIGPDRNGHFYQKNNPWTELGYYYFSDREPAEGSKVTLTDEEAPAVAGATPAVTFTDYAGHETDLVSPGEMGHYLVGEDMRYTPSRRFSFDLTDVVEGTQAWLRCTFFSNAPASAPSLTISANGSQLGTAARLPVTRSGIFGDTTLITREFVPSASRLSIDLNCSAGGTLRAANLDALTINYERKLQLNAGALTFNSASPTLRLAGATAATRVWDVTSPVDVKNLKTSADGTDGVSWTNPYSGPRRYVAWNEGATLPAPAFVENVANQNLHGEPTPDMIILSIAAARSEAERLAALHAEVDSLRVLVLSPERVYNEFGSGSADMNAIRRMLKFFYDRGADEEGHRLQFFMLFGRPTYDNRHLTENLRLQGYETLPIWQSDQGNIDSYSFCTDDYYAYLEDDSGAVPGTDRQCIGVGRVTSRNAVEAREYVDKVIAFVKRPVSGDWKNKYIVVADDQDNGIHLKQAEDFIAAMNSTSRGNEVLYNKIYLDAYEKEGGVTVGARDNMYKLLNEGTAWWCYVGHSSIDTWSGEGILKRVDLNNNCFFKRIPFAYAATCTFQSWDGSLDSGAELLVNNPSGGVIAMICPTRKVYISSNGVFSNQMGRAMQMRDEQGRSLPVGEVFRRAKNGGSRDANHMRYVLQGDPALRTLAPAYRIIVTEIGGTSIEGDDEAQPTLKARQQAVVKGYITDGNGQRVPGFNGSLTLSLYDAEESVTTLGRGTADDPGKVDVFEQHGSRLFVGRDSVAGGNFEVKIAMPADIADNFRPATINLYAIADDGTEAMGLTRQVYVFGRDDTAPADDTPPSVDAIFMNHESFANGDIVNENPMFFARVSDDIGINLSQAGIGHSLMMRVDDDDAMTDVSDYYTPASDGTPGGTVAYPLSNLSAGNHAIEFRVWDTGGNHAAAAIDFYVQPGVAPTIFDIYTDTNPATDHANFYVSHNRPDATLEVTVEVFNMMGQQIWSSASRGRSDMFVSNPVTWDLRDRAGHRVDRGIYLYRATVATSDGQQSTGQARRLAVTGQ